MDIVKKERLKVIFLGGKQAGIIGLLATVVSGCEVKAVVTVSDMMEQLSNQLRINVYHSVKQQEIYDLLPNIDLLISVHSREIIPMELLNIPRLGGINVHPCLWKYKGKNPIQRFLQEHESQASVGVHRMTEDIDMGETLFEMFVDIDRIKVTQVVEVYNILYSLYGLVLLKTLDSLVGGNK